MPVKNNSNDTDAFVPGGYDGWHELLVKQNTVQAKLQSLHKTVEASVWVYKPEQHFQTEFGMFVNRIVGHWCCFHVWGTWCLLWEPGKVVLSPLDTFQGSKKHLHVALGDVVWGWWWWCWVEDGTGWFWRSLPTLMTLGFGDSVILWFVWPFLGFFWPFPSALVLTDGSWALGRH